MITVSNEFKKAIKNTERRIKGYVEVLYDIPSIAITTTPSYSSNYTSIDEITDGCKVENDYGSLDYLPLDGTRLTVLDGINTNAGYISDELFEDISNPTINFAFEESTIKGITIYFKDNFPTDMTLQFSDSSSKTIRPTSEIVQIIFDEPKTITNMSITINEMQYNDRKIKIQEVDLGISYVYKDQDLIEFTVDEEVNKLMEEVPINETNVIINNINELFNPLNPKGITKYLSEGSKIIPYIGVLTKNLGVEYVKMGEFYFDNYINNSDKTTTLNGKSIIKQVETATITNGLIATNGGYILDRKVDPYNRTFKGLIENSGFPITVQLDNILITRLPYIDNVEMSNFIKLWCLLQNAIFLSNRNSDLIVKNINFEVVDNLSKSELINDAQYKQIDRVNTLKKIIIRKESNDTYGGSLTTYKMFDRYQFVLKENPQTFVVDKPTSHDLANFVNTFENGTGEILWENQNFAIIRISGDIGNTATLTSTWEAYYSSRSSSTITSEAVYTTKKENEKEIMVEVKDLIGFGSTADNYKNILNYTPSYEMSFEYNGDPSFEAGDYINVETPYGYKKIFIQKNTFKFNGGLTGSIEGVE